MPTEKVIARGITLLQCDRCGLVFVRPEDRLSPETSKERYLLHDNRIEDRAYCTFLTRSITTAKPFLTPGSRGLDYGCGHGPVLSRLLEAEGFAMTDYDPIFFDVPLEKSYDFIFSTECFEHFEDPKQDIGKVLARLRPGGILAIMTELWDDGTDFKDWYYASDPTHISFYSKKTLAYICENFGIRQIAGDGKRVFVFQKNNKMPGDIRGHSGGPLRSNGLFIAAIVIQSWLAIPAFAKDFLYSDAEADCAARVIYMNECSGNEDNLLYWSVDEAFPSLGIGHFIWYPENARGPYRESFPNFLSFAEEIGLEIPKWITDLPDRHAPWLTRDGFMDDLKSERMKELRAFLKNSRREQAHFILRRFQRTFPGILEEFGIEEQRSMLEKYDLLMGNSKGALAMADYVNFKGEGLRTDAHYDGIGWGLAQVLLEMEMPDNPGDVLHEFVLAAERVLKRRIEHAPRPEVEAKWLPGWKNRLTRYLSVDCN